MPYSRCPHPVWKAQVSASVSTWHDYRNLSSTGPGRVLKVIMHKAYIAGGRGMINAIAPYICVCMLVLEIKFDCKLYLLMQGRQTGSGMWAMA